MKKVFKYHLGFASLGTPITLQLPGGWQFLRVAHQNNTPHIWALIDQEEPLVTSTFIIYGTGWHIHDRDNAEHRYLGTWDQESSGSMFVWHLFELIPTKEVTKAIPPKKTFIKYLVKTPFTDYNGIQHYTSEVAILYDGPDYGVLGDNEIPLLFADSEGFMGVDEEFIERMEEE